jgi:hypothetical protein
VALDRYDRAVAMLDTTVTIRHDQRLTEEEWLVGRAELELPGGRWSYRAALQQGDSAGLVLPRDSVRVVNTDGSWLALSDIALGSPGRAVSWITEDRDTVLLAPSALFRKGSEVETYYEVTGTMAQTLYRHEITVLRAAGRESDTRGRPLVSLSFDEAAGGEMVKSRRTIRLDRLKPGNYVVEVRVTAPDGSSQVRGRLIRLIDH